MSNFYSHPGIAGGLPKGNYGFLQEAHLLKQNVVGQYPLFDSFPAGISGNVVEIPLDRFGIQNFYIKVSFQVINTPTLTLPHPGGGNFGAPQYPPSPGGRGLGGGG